jgi:hypothetical protein
VKKEKKGEMSLFEEFTRLFIWDRGERFESTNLAQLAADKYSYLLLLFQ